MGGGEIARYLSRHGAGRIRQAALVASVVPYVLKTDDNAHGVPGEKLDEMRQRVRKDRFGFLQDLGKQLYGVGLVSHPVSQGVLDWTFMLALMASPKATLDCIDAFGRTDFRPDLPAFTVPTLVVHGTSDATVPIDATGRAAAKGIPSASMIEYEGQPHGLFATAADRLTSDLLNFLSI